MKIAGYEIIPTPGISEEWRTNCCPCYQIIRPDDGGPLAGLPVAWADSELGACAMALGGAYVSSLATGGPDEIKAAHAAITDFVGKLR